MRAFSSPGLISKTINRRDKQQMEWDSLLEALQLLSEAFLGRFNIEINLAEVITNNIVPNDLGRLTSKFDPGRSHWVSTYQGNHQSICHVHSPGEQFGTIYKSVAPSCHDLLAKNY